MAVPGLQPHIDFEEQPEPRLINRKTGGALLVTAAEAQLIHAWDRSPSAARLSAAVFMNGLDVDPWQIEQFFFRLERLGCLAVPRPAIPNFVGPKPGVSTQEDKVPCLRRDLVIEKAPRSRSVFHVTDPKSKRAFGLLDSEVSVARMLDGKRRVSDVIENAAKLGIEVTLDSLRHFISHLKGYRFIDQDIREGESTWPAREKWTDEERQLYQASMKNLREGHFAVALAFAESLAAASPANLEARLLQHRVAVEAEGVVELVATFGDLHATPVREPAAAPAVEAPAPVALPVKPPPRPPQVKAFLLRHRVALAGGGLGLVLLAVLLRPVQVTTEVACELQVETLGVPRTTRGGKVALHDVKPGTHVEKGAVVARLGTGQTVEALEAKRQELEAALAVVPPATKDKRAVLARAKVKKAQAAAELARKKGWKLPQRELDGAKKSLDALTHEFTRAALEAELKAVREQRAALESELSRSIIIAPVAGIFVGVGALPEELAVNDSYGQIVGPNFKLVTQPPIPERIESATFRTGEHEVEVGITGGKPVFPVRDVFVGAKGTLEVKTGRTPWLASRFR